MTNNERKRKHLVKYTRHWKLLIPITFTENELKYVFADVKALKELLNKTYGIILQESCKHWNET